MNSWLLANIALHPQTVTSVAGNLLSAKESKSMRRQYYAILQRNVTSPVHLISVCADGQLLTGTFKLLPMCSWELLCTKGAIKVFQKWSVRLVIMAI